MAVPPLYGATIQALLQSPVADLGADFFFFFTQLWHGIFSNHCIRGIFFFSLHFGKLSTRVFFFTNQMSANIVMTSDVASG